MFGTTLSASSRRLKDTWPSDQATTYAVGRYRPLDSPPGAIVRLAPPSPLESI
jgi:hypothetical protein